MSMIYCWHAPDVGALKLGFTGSSNPAQAMYSYARKHGVRHEHYSLIMLECPEFVEHIDMEEGYAHLVLEKARLPRIANRELFLLDGFEYYEAAYCIMRSCQRLLWQMTEPREPEPLMKRVAGITGRSPNKPFDECPEFPRHVSERLDFRFAHAEKLVEPMLHRAWHKAMKYIDEE